MNTHVFALYYSSLSREIVKISDKDLVFRISKVLRLANKDRLILFNEEINVLVELGEIGKGEIFLTALDIRENKKPLPELILAQAITKREAFESVIYSSVELGVNNLIPICSIKSQQRLTSTFERIKRISIAAAEQSKNFCLTEVGEMLNLKDFLRSFEHEPDRTVKIRKIFLTHTGKSPFIPSDQEKTILLIGPEGDFTKEEYNLIEQAGFESVSISQFVLRSEDAAFLGIGLVRFASQK